MRHYRKFIPLLLLAVLLGAPLPGMAQVTGDCDQSIGESTLDINNVRARILNNGNLFWRGDPHVYEVPKGGGVNAIFASGIWVGGLIDGQLHLAGSTYGPYEFWPGPLDDNGNPPDDCNAFDRIYKVSKEDVVAFEGSGIASNDLLEWPTGLGAPTFYEVDTDTGLTRVDIVLQPDGSLDHIVKRDDGTEEVLQTEALSFEERKARLINLGAGERPAILGDQMLWWVMNDRGNVHGRTNGLPIGLEVHGTVFAFNTAGAIGNTTFYKYRFFYKGDVPLTQTYMGIFVDPDLGNFDDDYVGSDTTLGLGFVYNADNDDEGGYGANPPALGYDFFQGPLVNDDGIDNDEDGEVDEADERLQMTSFVFYNNGGCSDTCDPSTAEEYYNYMRALWKDGVPITFGGDGRNFSQIPTKFMFPGDPESGAFWSELNSDGANTAIAPADRRFVMSTGPFTIKPGDEQEIVFGIVWSRGANNLNSVTKLKEDDALAQAVFDIDFELPAPPAAPRVKATPLDSRVILEWSYLPTDNNYLESYRVIDPLLSPDVQDRDYVFEGYNVFRFDSPQDQEGELIAVYDVPNGITRVIEGTGLTFLTADGTDSGIQHHHIIDGLTNYQTYFFGVQAYAYNAESGQKVYAGPIRRVEVVPTRIEARNGGTVLAEEALTKAFQANAEADIVAAKDGKGGGSVTVDVVNPAEVTGHSYRVEFYEVCDEAGKQGTVSFAKTGEDDAPRSGDVAANGGCRLRDDLRCHRRDHRGEEVRRSPGGCRDGQRRPAGPERAAHRRPLVQHRRPRTCTAAPRPERG
ncbi:MAG: hypothetical protein KatS3mg042_0342 [Rhodothermaceae bacterium]|nr:MAG: hypothetical protein KatS3mg042_0342 [Rhodothermaceae bacterium]